MTTSETPTTTVESRSESESKYAVFVENTEVGMLLLGMFTTDSPSEAVRSAIGGDHQSPPSDPAYEIAAADATTFTVYEVTRDPVTITRGEATSNGSWTVTRHGETVTISYNDEPAIDVPQSTIGVLFESIATVYPSAGTLPVTDDTPVTQRKPAHDAFVNSEVGPVRIYPVHDEEDAIMWVGFTDLFRIPSVQDGADLLDLLHQLFPDQTAT